MSNLFSESAFFRTERAVVEERQVVRNVLDSGPSRPPRLPRSARFVLLQDLTVNSAVPARMLVYDRNSGRWIPNSKAEFLVLHSGAEPRWPAGTEVTCVHIRANGYIVSSSQLLGRFRDRVSFDSYSVLQADFSADYGDTLSVSVCGLEPWLQDFVFTGELTTTARLPAVVSTENGPPVFPIFAGLPAWVAYDAQDGIPLPGETWGPVQDSTKIRKSPIGTISRGYAFDRHTVVTTEDFRFDEVEDDDPDDGIDQTCYVMDMEFEPYEEDVIYGWTVLEVDTILQIALVDRPTRMMFRHDEPAQFYRNFPYSVVP